MGETQVLIPGSGKSPGEWNSGPLQCSCLENLMTEEPGRQHSTRSQRVKHDWPTSLSLFTTVRESLCKATKTQLSQKLIKFFKWLECDDVSLWFQNLPIPPSIRVASDPALPLAHPQPFDPSHSPQIHPSHPFLRHPWAHQLTSSSLWYHVLNEAFPHHPI